MEMKNMRSLLEKWANLEPQRCRYNSNETIEVLYKNQWHSVSQENPVRDGILIMALLEVGDERNYLYSIEKIPRPEANSDYDSEPQILVGVGMRDAWRSAEGENLASTVVELFLSEYLGCFARDN
ncbi:MAG: hypothetical protein F6K40_24345 [Okeania sp. SIO3I5]|uniref:hypothetical protein n=1 Tax=Okeania sp. SIO3I5 TaxID=2607805 RepID=UPI0013B610F4|nr:hypothetical protein [Okeania sp. SIO3I5]NEQ39209.1 hypothetical protein [Okeania sp. SIO3I5]